MPQPRIPNAIEIAADFLTRCFARGESIALLLRRENPDGIIQRIVPLKRALAPRYLGWLAHENSIGANVYVAANPVLADSRKRTKDSIASVRHLYLDLDTDGEARLASLRASDTVPTPNAIVSTSLGKYQVLWRVDGFTLEQQESALKLLTITFGGDPACTDCNRVLRLPGFLNCKIRSGVSGHRRIPRRFDMELRRLPAGRSSGRCLAFVAFNHIAKALRSPQQFRARLGMGST